MKDKVDALREANTGKTISIWFQDGEADRGRRPRKPPNRVGQKGRTAHVWWQKGQRPPGLCDKRFTFAYIFGAAKAGADDAFALVMPRADTAAMNIFLAEFAKTLPENEHAVLVLDQAGWHGANGLHVPNNVSLVFLPP